MIKKMVPLMVVAVVVVAAVAAIVVVQWLPVLCIVSPIHPIVHLSFEFLDPCNNSSIIQQFHQQTYQPIGIDHIVMMKKKMKMKMKMKMVAAVDIAVDIAVVAGTVVAVVAAVVAADMADIVAE